MLFVIHLLFKKNQKWIFIVKVIIKFFHFRPLLLMERRPFFCKKGILSLLVEHNPKAEGADEDLLSDGISLS